ncbi:hypothetical protein Tco_1272699 [Tanacetum coccineum]
MTIPRPTPFLATTPRTEVLVPFAIIFDSDDEITTLLVRPAPPSSDRIPALSSYPLDSGDDSLDEDLSETAEPLYTQTASTSVVRPPSTRPLPTSPAFARRPGKEISMPLGYEAAIDRWTAAPPSTCHPLLPSEIPSSSPPSLLPSSSRKRFRSPSPSLPPSVSPSPLPSLPPTAVPPPPEHIKSVGDDIEILRANSLRIARGRITRSKIRAVYDEQEVRELREFWVTDRLEIIELRIRAEYAKSCVERSHKRQTGDGARTQRTDMTKQDIEASRSRAEAAEQRAETLQVSLGAARIDARDLIESREADRFEMAELWN